MLRLITHSLVNKEHGCLDDNRSSFCSVIFSLTMLRLFFLILQAYESLSDGLGKSAAVLVQNPLKKFQRGSGAGPALAAAVRAVPAAAIAPASACASAVHYALLGFRNRSVIKLT